MLRESAVNKLAKYKDRAAPPQKPMQTKPDEGQAPKNSSTGYHLQRNRSQVEDWAARGTGPITMHDEGGGLEMPTMRRRDKILWLQTPRPAGVSAGTATPRTEKILDWTTAAKSQAQSMDVASKIGSQADGEEEESGGGSVPADGEGGVPLDSASDGPERDGRGESSAGYVGKGKGRAEE
ncbi:hypothetical protein LTR85_001999 [Meristemomyces frigidus]|nr:hypothetical protein LTR85_001999 [Meristemomyces frigidus]